MKKMTRDEAYMAEAIRQARKAYKLGETPIGCVIVRTHDYEGKPVPETIVSRGYNRRNTDKKVSSHAEIIAIDRASKALSDWRLEGCTMYVTLEPCQMCAGALVQSRIDRVVIGAMNPKAGCAGSVLDLLREPRFNHQCDVTTGVLQERCSELLQSFFRELREGKKKE